MRKSVFDRTPAFFAPAVKQDHLFRLNRAIDYIHRNFDEDLHLGKLADVACFSKYHFHRLFKTFVGETLNDFIRRIRLEKALHRVILEEHQTITDIAYACGFSSSQNFAKAFKAYFGIPATTARDKFGWESKKRLGSKNSSVTVMPSFLSQAKDRFTDGGMMNTKGRSKTAVSMSYKTISTRRVAYIRHIGPYHAETIASISKKLIKDVKSQDLGDTEPKVIVAVWNNPKITPEKSCICDICIAMPHPLTKTETSNTQSLPGGKFAACRYALGPSDFPVAWAQIVQDEIFFSRYRPDHGPVYILYYGGGPPHSKHWNVDLCLPVEPL